MQQHYNYGCFCTQAHSNSTAAAFLLVLARILSLQAILSAIIVVLICTQLPARSGNDQEGIILYLVISHFFRQQQLQPGMSVRRDVRDHGAGSGERPRRRLLHDVLAQHPRAVRDGE